MVTRYRGIVVVAGAIAIVWIVSLLQLLHAPDGWVYDQAVRLGGWNSSAIPSVLMVETDARKELTADEGLAVIDYLQQLGAWQVIFISLPLEANERFLRQAQAYGNIIVGRTVASTPYSSRIAPPTRHSPAHPAGAAVLASGSLAIPLAEFGIHRHSATAVKVGEEEFPTLAMVAAEHRGQQPEPGEFKVNFNQGADWLPRVSVDRVLRKGLIAEIVTGRSVVIGNFQSPTAPGFHTPINANGQGMSLLEFQAYAIDTLLQGKQVSTTPWALNLVMLGLIGLLSLIVYQWFNLDRSGWFTIFLLGCYLGMGWLLLHALLIWIPVVELAVAQVLMFWLFIRFKLLEDDQQLRHTVLQRMARLQEYMLPPDFYNLDEHWAQVITFVDQTLNLNRVIFLEKVEGDHRVREVQALRCSLQDIDERRRDFERAPYSEAIAEAGPIKLEHRLFFSGAPDGASEQYLVPLLFGGEVQGFWAFDVDPVAVEASEIILGTVRDFANQIAELLYHRHQWIKQRDSEKNAVRRFFRLEAGKASAQEFGELLELLDNRLIALQAVFDGLATAAIQYDIFGRVVQVNSSMEEFMRQQELPGYKLTALDLLVEITGMAQHRARRLLQQVIVDRRDFHIPVRLKDTQENHSVHVKPLAAPEAQAAAGASNAPFELAGILFELSDERSLKKRFEIKEQLLEWMRLRIRKDLSSLLENENLQRQPLLATATDLREPVEMHKVAEIGSLKLLRNIPKPSGNPDSSPRFSAGLAEVLSNLDRVEAALSADRSNPSSSVHPLDVYPLLTSAIGAMEATVVEKRLKFNTEIPRLMGLTNAQPDQLRLLFSAILDILVTDAAADTELNIQVKETEDALHFTFNNNGFGIPDEHLQVYIWQPEYGDTEEFKDLREAVQPIADWGGNIEIHSEVGVGIWANLQLELVR